MFAPMFAGQMRDQDEGQWEDNVAVEPQRVASSAGSPASLDRQVRSAIEILKLKLENLKLYLASRGNR